MVGTDHALTLTIVDNLARDYADEHRLEEAYRLATEVLDSSRRVLGPDHPMSESSAWLTSNVGGLEEISSKPVVLEPIGASLRRFARSSP